MGQKIVLLLIRQFLSFCTLKMTTLKSDGPLLRTWIYIATGSILLFSVKPALACQPCAAYSATELHGFAERKMTLGLSEVYTKYQTTNGLRRLRSGEILRYYSTTEVNLSYD